MSSNMCVCCGEIIPEGRQVCPICEKGEKMAEQRLIDANALLKKLSRMTEYCKTDSKVNGLTALFQVGDAVMDCPTVDAVEVVRCKDCEFWGGVIFGNVCRRWSAPLAGMKNCTTPDDFCSYGQRKEN